MPTIDYRLIGKISTGRRKRSVTAQRPGRGRNGADVRMYAFRLVRSHPEVCVFSPAAERLWARWHFPQDIF